MGLAKNLIDKSYNTQLIEEENARQQNIQKLINYYNGDQIRYLKSYIKLKNLDDFPYYASNITKRIIRKLAEVYKEAPVRSFNGKKDDKYNEFTKKKNRVMKTVERQTRLLGLVGVRPIIKIDNKEKYFEYYILRQFQAYFDKGIEPIAIKYLIQDTGEEQYYEFWNKDNHFILDSENLNIDVSKFGIKDDINHYGKIPYVWCHSEEIIDDWYNTGGSADDLINSNLMINLKLSEMAHKYRYAAFNPPWVTGMEKTDSLSWGYNEMIALANTDARIGSLNLSHDFSKDIELIKFDIQNIERNNGLNINWGISGNTSGFSLVIQNIDHSDDLLNMIEIARGWEQDLFKMEQIVGNVDGIKVNQKNLTIDYTEVKAPLSQEEKNKKWEFEFKHGLSSREDYWRAGNPDISDEDIKTKIEGIGIENKLVNESSKTEKTISELFGGK